MTTPRGTPYHALRALACSWRTPPTRSECASAEASARQRRDLTDLLCARAMWSAHRRPPLTPTPTP